MRVILWGPGQMGIGALRALIQHPGLELAGLVVHSEAKEGRDAGDLCGLPATGIIATRDIDAALAVDADAVAYYASGDYRYREAADDIARCLRAGKNVVTTSIVLVLLPARRRARPAGDARARVSRGRRHDAVQQRRRARAGSTTWCRSCSARPARASTRSRCRRSSTTRRSRSPTSCTTSWASPTRPRRHPAAGAGPAQPPVVAGRLGPRRRGTGSSSTRSTTRSRSGSRPSRTRPRRDRCPRARSARCGSGSSA